ncbi:serine carboxypeptidase S28-domain-containing protein [Massariosphaeria phaeospora]|uniref:Serine carboxypeptidase S28-domain-containing protein n=1 Tax=Massariosphaeria phaeospora TaxID=100035 RepID=A0A7C8ICP2_9PLEO|nr:serine carboxypeptidase S28-domain-containing protein [Massariosphaeria phaeospora]
MHFSTTIASFVFALEAAAIPFGHLTGGQLSAAQVAKKWQSLAKRDEAAPAYPAYNLSVPIDFFPDDKRYEPHSNGTFNLRYWVDDTYYKPGGPVFVLLSGETSGENRLPFMATGISNQVAQATAGLSVILEHRYYGTSFPFPDASTKNLRFLSTEQALAEIDYFARHVKFEGIAEDLTAPNAPWIVYGGSYAGAQAAFLRVVYPDTFWGAISSSGVTTAIYDYWEYYEPIRQFAPPDCVRNTQTMVDVVDSILLHDDQKDKVARLQEAFGLGQITDKRDFANVLTSGITGWQSTNWDPELNSPSFFYYCGNLTGTVNYDNVEHLRPTVKELVSVGGYVNDSLVENITLNAIGYFGRTSVAAWNESGETQDAFFSVLNDTFWQDTSLVAAEAWRSWSYQVCTEWGYIQTGSTPADIKPLISRTLDLEYLTYFCRSAFNITQPPDLWQVNKYGNYSIEYSRLAIIGGNADPWRPATPLANGSSTRVSSTDKPWLEIAHGVHHWEENGVPANETTPIFPPAQVVYAQQFVKNFVIDWVKEFNDQFRLEL